MPAKGNNKQLPPTRRVNDSDTCFGASQNDSPSSDGAEASDATIAHEGMYTMLMPTAAASTCQRSCPARCIDMWYRDMTEGHNFHRSIFTNLATVRGEGESGRGRGWREGGGSWTPLCKEPRPSPGALSSSPPSTGPFQGIMGLRGRATRRLCGHEQCGFEE